MNTVLIVEAPEGEAPLWVREAWVGLRLPTPDAKPSSIVAFGVVTGPKTWLQSLLAIVFGRSFRQTGYHVAAGEAVQRLAAINPEAAEWWRENIGYILRAGGALHFNETACQLVD